jgi:hypothetical protein
LEWVRAWAPHAKQELVEIAKIMRRFPWMVEVVRQRPVSHPHPYMVEVYVARDESEVCLMLNQLKTFCARNGAVKEVKLELEFKRYEVYEDKIRGVHRPKGLLAFSTTSKEYIESSKTPFFPLFFETPHFSFSNSPTRLAASRYQRISTTCLTSYLYMSM